MDTVKLGVTIAESHQTGKNTRLPKWLMSRVTSQEQQILQVYRTLDRESGGGRPSSPTAEWLLDNYYIIEEQIKDIKHNLARKGYFRLPVLRNEQLKGYPRIFAIALELAKHSDGSIDENKLVSFIKGYQTLQPLSMGELWALPVMLRIALLEKVSQICTELNVEHQQRHEAEHVAKLIIAAAEQGDEAVEKLISNEIEDRQDINPSLIELLVQLLRKNGRKTAVLVALINQKLVEKGSSLEQLISSEHGFQAIRQVSMGNAITSLRMIAAVDWNDIFEALSYVEEILNRDPSGYYSQMDFDSRDHYRHVLERVARFHNISEIEVGEKVLHCAQEAPVEDNQNPLRHVGYYLVSTGRKELERQIGRLPGGLKAALYFLKGHPRTVYFGSILGIFLPLMVFFLGYALNQLTLSPLSVALLGLVLLIPLSDISINIINFAISRSYSPTVLPKLELRDGITEVNSTMVIIPTLLPGEKRVRELLENLEIYYLGNKQNNLFFALVGDFKDGTLEETEDDQQIIDAALKGINELNHRYSKDKPIFYYFHRERWFNEAQNHWMGWERKRGVIIEFNDLLRGAKDTSFTTISCNPEQIPFVKYVITLDADTNLPIGTAKRLIGTMAHPLNRPVVDKEKGIVVEQHAILQPRIDVSIDSANKTLFSRIFAGQGGIDPYTTAVSDVYQDLFGEGIFTGKGIYELDTFQSILKEAIPDNSVLSHDLLEGSYLRAGLVTDIALIDGYPSRYNSFSMRLHRWVRGDWQLIPWLGERVKDRQGQWRKNPLTALSKWKIIDNLRRSLLNPALFLLILLGFFLLPGNSLIWLGLAVVTVSFPTIIYLAGELLTNNHRVLGSKGQTVITGFRASLYQAVLQFMFIPYQAYLMTDAVARTLARVLVTRNNLLEWIPAADQEALLKNDFQAFLKKMLVAPALGLLVLGLAILGSSTSLQVAAAALVCVLWFSAPYVAYRVSQDYVTRVEQLDEAEQSALRRLARKTWAYFEDLVTTQDNYLPPDNFQVDPPNGIAHRTSPTNIGLLLVSTLAARDLGYLGTREMLEKLSATLNTVEKLEKWQGHLYNWYDTITLRVLRPSYISTVDSGNFVGYLIVLEEGLKEYLHKPLEDPAFAQGLLDTIKLHNEEISEDNGVINTQPLEGYLENSHSWPAVLASIRTELTREEVQVNLQKFRWGKKVRVMVEHFEDERTFHCDQISEQIEALMTRIRSLIDNTRFTPLFDPKRQLFSIGYLGEEGILTKSYYDLLASEARLASYIAVARGEVDQKHWFRLGRKLTRVDNYKGLVSWSGTMFEYFMPLLVMKNFENSLLDVTYSFVVNAQKKYGEDRQIPWGISESAYYAFDAALNYQYKAFGVPELGFKRGLGNELVVAPYASVLALTTDPKGAILNILKLRDEGLDGDYGLYEAIDYTAVRVSRFGKKAIIKNFMVHHQGMSILALTNYLNQNIMQRRFHTNPVIKSAEALLQERMPSKVTIVKEHREEYLPLKSRFQTESEVVRNYGIPNQELPNVHLLANGTYSVMLTDGGSGYSKHNDMAVARWKETLHSGGSGFFIYIQNINSNNVWSATYEPYKVEPEDYKVVFSPDKAEYFRKDGNLETHMQIVVSPEDNAELRTITLTNNSGHSRILEVTSYLEVVLTHPAADLAHPAFSNLFITTEFLPQHDCLLAVRRPRTSGQLPVYALHTVTVEGEVIGDLQYETDRSKFIGRNRDLHNPLALDVDQPLSNSIGAVLDPVMCLRRRVKIESGQSVRVSYTLATADNRTDALRLANKYRDPKVIERAFKLAWNRSRIEAGYLDIKVKDMEVYLKLVSSLLFPGPARHKYEEIIIRNKKGQSGLWPFGVSGDLPLVVVHINDVEQIELAYHLLRAHEFWRMKGLKVDLIFLAEDEGGYVQPLQDRLREAISASHARELMNQSGGVYLLNSNMVEEADRNLIFAAARIILRGDAGPIEEQLTWEEQTVPIPKLEIFNSDAIGTGKTDVSYFDPMQLVFFNGFGGFSQDGQEYVIQLKEGQHTPAPWINVIANPRFGFSLTEVGAGYTWAENSRENKLTPWYNDPVTDPLGEVFYLRDEQSGEYWSITPMPIREPEDYIVRHGKGYTSFEHTSHSIAQELTEFVALEDPVKICLISLKNLSKVTRNLSLTFYLRPVLGVNEKVNAQFIVTQKLEEKGILVLSNPYNQDFPGRLVFIDTSEVPRTFTGDGQEFLGINGSLELPAALERVSLSGTVGAGMEPCGAMQVKVSLDPGEDREIVFLLGQTQDLGEVASVTDKYSKVAVAKKELASVKTAWSQRLGNVQVSTPDKSMDLLLNGWLQYQVIACRLWSRAAFYQSGGAYGFRDQLQDSLAVVYTWPELTKKQILLHAAHQFVEGDVQHWWHPGANKGIRTRYSDDLLWLPYVTADYIQCTEDWSILEEEADFLADDPLPENEDERYNIPQPSGEKGTVYLHCTKAIDIALKFGVHQLPLMGSGDWNDGMNTVGNQGKGESVWLAWFLYTVLQRYIPICKARQDEERAERYSSVAQELAQAIEQNAWDGSWYRRAYFDDGTPLGSAENTECKIDSIAQSWSVISGIGRPHRTEEALEAVDKFLVDREAGIIKLLTPPFGEGELHPGYIKGYGPGVRENGGQYTHAAVWTILAFAKLGEGDKVGELFSLINPINHTRTAINVLRYKVEPYVLAADVYAVHPNTGRGGWSWYTGAASWMYRVGIEHILGIKKAGTKLYFDPCIPKAWQEFRVNYRFSDTIYKIHVQNPERMSKGVKKVILNGQEASGGFVSLVDNGREQVVEVILGKPDVSMSDQVKPEKNQ